MRSALSRSTFYIARGGGFSDRRLRQIRPENRWISPCQTHELWAHSRRGTENPGRADGARCASLRFRRGTSARRASVLRRGRRAPRCHAGVALTIAQRVLPAVDQTIVTAERAVPHNMGGRLVQFSDDLAAAASATRAAPAGHVRQPIALRKVVGDPGHDRAKEKPPESAHVPGSPPADLRSPRQDSAGGPRPSRQVARCVSSTRDQRRRRGRAPSRSPTRVASSRFTRHQSATHSSMPRNRK